VLVLVVNIASILPVILGRTAIGRAMVEVLHLHRPELLNLRHALRAIGLYPPEPA